MKWLTKTQIRKAAAKSDLAACECSYEHWMQIKQAGAKELRKANGKDKVHWGEAYCALCRKYEYYNNCGSCCLGPNGRDRVIACCREYEKVRLVLNAWKRGKASYKAVQKAITPLTNRLRAAVRKARAK